MAKVCTPIHESGNFTSSYCQVHVEACERTLGVVNTSTIIKLIEHYGASMEDKSIILNNIMLLKSGISYNLTIGNYRKKRLLVDLNYFLEMIGYGNISFTDRKICVSRFACSVCREHMKMPSPIFKINVSPEKILQGKVKNYDTKLMMEMNVAFSKPGLVDTETLRMEKRMLKMRKVYSTIYKASEFPKQERVFREKHRKEVNKTYKNVLLSSFRDGNLSDDSRIIRVSSFLIKKRFEENQKYKADKLKNDQVSSEKKSKKYFSRNKGKNKMGEVKPKEDIEWVKVPFKEKTKKIYSVLKGNKNDEKYGNMNFYYPLLCLKEDESIKKIPGLPGLCTSLVKHKEKQKIREKALMEKKKVEEEKARRLLLEKEEKMMAERKLEEERKEKARLRELEPTNFDIIMNRLGLKYEKNEIITKLEKMLLKKLTKLSLSTCRVGAKSVMSKVESKKEKKICEMFFKNCEDFFKLYKKELPSS